ESEATIWVLRASPELATTSPDDPNATVIQTAASQQADLLNQLLQTKEFLRDVVRQTSLRAALAAAPDETKFLAGVQKSFRVQTHGNNLLTVSFAAHDPPLGPEMVNAILAVRADRVAQASTTFTTITNTLYQKQLQVAQAQALDAQRALDEFDASHPGALSDIEQHLKDQLRLTLDYAQIRLGDLRGRINQAALAPAILSVSGMEFQVVDQPQVETSPRGGTRSAAMIGAVAIAAGCALARGDAPGQRAARRRELDPSLADTRRSSRIERWAGRATCGPGRRRGLHPPVRPLARCLPATRRRHGREADPPGARIVRGEG